MLIKMFVGVGTQSSTKCVIFYYYSCRKKKCQKTYRKSALLRQPALFRHFWFICYHGTVTLMCYGNFTSTVKTLKCLAKPMER